MLASLNQALPSDDVHCLNRKANKECTSRSLHAKNRQESHTAQLISMLTATDTVRFSNSPDAHGTGTEAWFESTIRTDVNGGVNTRAGLKARDPRLAAVMAEMFGDGAWR